MMKKVIFAILMFGVVFASFGQGDIKNPASLNVIGGDSIRSFYPRTQFYTFGKVKEFESGDINNSHFYQLLDGEWKYRYFSSSEQLNDNGVVMPNYDDSSWSKYNINSRENLLSSGGISTSSGAFSLRLPKENPVVVYRSVFKVPLTWDERQIFASIGQLAGSSEIYVNGIRMGFNEDSRAMNNYDITPACKEGLNSIAIVSYGYGSGSYLESGENFVGLSIGEDVVVWSAPKLQLRDYIINTTFDPTFKNGLLEFGALIRTHYMNDHEVRLFFELIDSEGEVVDSQRKYSELNMRTEDTVYFNVPIQNVKRWSETDPNLYTIRLKVQKEMRFTEFLEIPVGFRQVDIKYNELRINGVKSMIKGVALKQNEIPRDREKYELFLKNIKAKGANAIWITGSQSEDFYRAADKEGVYIFSAANINGLSQGKSLRYGLDNYPKMLGKYISRQESNYEVAKSHASVVAFALGRDGSNGYNMYESYILLEGKKSLRPIIYKGAGDEWNSDIYLSDNMSAKEVKNYNTNNDNPVLMMLDNISNFSKIWSEIEENSVFNGVILSSLTMLDDSQVRESFREFDAEYINDKLIIHNFTKDPIEGYGVEYVLRDKSGVKLIEGEFEIELLKSNGKFEYLIEKSVDKIINVDTEELKVDLKLFQKAASVDIVLIDGRGTVVMNRVISNVKEK